MKNRERLKRTVVQVARERFGGNEFRRRPLMEAVEKKLREIGVWTSEDDQISGSTGIKSKGLA